MCIYICICVYIYVCCVHTYICVCPCHIFFIGSSVDGHLGYFHVLSIVNSTAKNIGAHVSF